MNFQLPDLIPMRPELMMTALALIVILVDLFVKKKTLSLHPVHNYIFIPLHTVHSQENFVLLETSTLVI